LKTAEKIIEKRTNWFWLAWYTFFVSTMVSKILIVEDEPDTAATWQSYLGRRGFQVSTTASGREALQMSTITAFDVIILDFSLKDLNGQEVLEQLRRMNHAARVVMITGQLFTPEKIKEICSLGVDGYFHKPVALEEMGRMVQGMAGWTSTGAIEQYYQSEDESTGGLSFFSCQRTGFHKLVNLMGIMRNRCENFILSREDGTYADRNEQMLLNMAENILREVVETVDESLTIVDHLRGDE